MNTTFLKPIIQAVIACFLWGIVFAMPVYLHEFSSIDIIIGRFLIYGFISTLFFVIYSKINKQTDCLKYWKEATLCALIMNIIYFSSLIFGSRFTAPSIITLIIGTGPITITIFSCLLKKDKGLLSLFLFPSLSIFLGLSLMSVEAIQSEIGELSLSEHAIGFIFGFIALSAWTWYVIFNSKVLNKNKDINPIQWTSLIGMITFFFTLVAFGFHLIYNDSEYFTQFSFDHDAGKTFWIGILTLGIFCSWAAFSLWNLAGSHLHPALSGQLSILETFFGLILIYILQFKVPTIMEACGAFFILAGVSSGLYSYSKKQQNQLELKEA